MLKLHSLLSDYGIRAAGPGDRHFTQGWVNLPCPFCSGNPGNHLGWNEASRFFHCFRCGSKTETEVLRAILRVSWAEASRIRDLYQGVDEQVNLTPSRRSKRIQEASFPLGTGGLSPRHESYLKGRGFDPPELVETWGIRGSTGVGRFSWRILAPVLFRGIRISYVGRDITGKSPEKYKTCPQPQEVFPHKETLYGLDEVPDNQSFGIVVEGIFDVWRLGPGAVGLFGSAFNHHQVQKLLERFRRVFVMLDSDAQGQAQKLAYTLAENGAEVEILSPTTDPGDMSAEEASTLLQSL